MVGSRTIDAIRRIRSGRPGQGKPAPEPWSRFQLPERFSMGNGYISLSDRGGRQRRRARSVDLGSLCSHAREDSGSEQCRRRQRPLSSVQRRRSADQGAGREGLSVFDCMASRFSRRGGYAKPERLRFLQSASRRVVGEWHRAVCNHVPLGFAPGAAGSLRRMVVAGHIEGVWGLYRLCRRAPERSREAYFHDQ